jgi:hypothetical protein
VHIAKYPDGTENSKLPNPSLSELPDDIEKVGLPKLNSNVLVPETPTECPA